MKELLLMPILLFAAWAGIWMLYFVTEPAPVRVHIARRK